MIKVLVVMLKVELVPHRETTGKCLSNCYIF